MTATQSFVKLLKISVKYPIPSPCDAFCGVQYIQNQPFIDSQNQMDTQTPLTDRETSCRCSDRTNTQGQTETQEETAQSSLQEDTDPDSCTEPESEGRRHRERSREFQPGFAPGYMTEGEVEFVNGQVLLNQITQVTFFLVFHHAHVQDVASKHLVDSVNISYLLSPSYILYYS